MPHNKEHEAIEEEQAFLSPSSSPNDAAWAEGRKSSKVMQYLRITLEVAMGLTIIGLLAYIFRGQIEHKRTPVPRFPKKIYKFLPDPHFVRDDMLFNELDTLRTLHNWLPLSPEARGYVQIPDYAQYPALGKPYTVPIDRYNEGPAYMTSVFHQLHCLSYVVSHYQRGYAGDNLTKEIAHHSAHCFDYLRQSIMCAADTNLEGETEGGPGWGSDHQCADYDAVLSWANERGAASFRNALLPTEAIL